MVEESKLVTIVIPTLNESKGIGKTLESIPAEEIRQLGYALETIVIDGNSADRTREVASGLGAEVIVEPRRGYGRAYKTGFLHSRGDIIVTLDGDGTYPSEYIPRLIKRLIDNELHFITTDRLTLAEHNAISGINMLGNIILSMITELTFNIRLKDSQSGMWIFRRRILGEIMPENDRMPFSEEIKIRAFLRLPKVTEVAIPYRCRIGVSKLKPFTDGFRNCLHLFRLWIMISGTTKMRAASFLSIMFGLRSVLHQVLFERTLLSTMLKARG